MLTPASQLRQSDLRPGVELLTAQASLLHSVPVHSSNSPFLPVCQTPRNELPKLEQWSVPQFAMRTENLTSRRLLKELSSLTKHPVNNCYAGPTGDSIFHWIAAISGAVGTVYEGGTFFLEISFTRDYPFKSPKVTFLTRIYHCNISSAGGIQLSVLDDGWQPTFSVRTILTEIVSLLEKCEPSAAVSGDVAKAYTDNRVLHDDTARLWTHRYAS